MKRTVAVLALATTILAIAPGNSDAQNTITATATVATTITVTGQQDLDFQLVLPGFTKTVLVTDPTAGLFLVAGGATAEVDVNFVTLPPNLDDGSGNLLPITYTGVYNTVSDPSAGATPFVPTAGAGPTANLSAAGELYVYLGGVVDATAPPPNGTYTGLVRMTAAYTGN